MVAESPRIDKLEDPTLITDDSIATKAGLKSYVHGGSYFGGGAPTITLDSGGGTLSSVDYSEFIPYQMQDGSWRLRFVFSVTLSSTTRTQAIFAVDGVVNISTALNISGSSTNTIAHRAFSIGSTDTFSVVHTSSTTDVYRLSGEVPLDDKPTWAF